MTKWREALLRSERVLAHCAARRASHVEPQAELCALFLGPQVRVSQ
jgi:hypothetical protein